MLEFLASNWSDLLVSAVGLSAMLVYWCQKRDRLRSAATLISGQIDSIEKRISALKGDHQLGNISVFHSNVILKENMWEQYKHIFVKMLTSSEYEMIQRFFDSAEQVERARMEIVNTMTNAWKDKSTVEHQFVGGLVANNCNDLEQEIQRFQLQYRPLDLVFTPDVAIQALTKNLSNFCGLIGTTAYAKIQRYSYTK